MAQALRVKFASIKSEVVNTTRELGIDDAMLMYGLKHRKCFIQWLEDNTGEEWSDDNELAGLHGGQKAMWLRQNREAVLVCLEVFGKDWAAKHFHLTHDTLDNFLQGDIQPFREKLTRTDRIQIDAREARKLANDNSKRLYSLEAKLEYAEANKSEVKREVNELKRAYGSFVESVTRQLGEAIIMPLLQRAIHPGEKTIVKPLDLSVETLIEVAAGRNNNDKPTNTM